ncbi:MAG: 50S ribosomal protein L29 [Geminicoccus sp.]|jgi:large subunit ribosomal protein L29|nr:50S ribosomal protein L29 [Geminicoccus sp.]MEC7140421.1 50S ribosomal protein L29 [Pseudomonadota bacterium]MEC8038873.1 50S ribosomal protein L29 [Pseudomonadota bacterium]MEC8155288.1 50S ribosomal protein L29 [Pseudomonadota bacterium]HCI01205.1 50S ribosomal protein L29 [Alphaproteobacteria bacterium]|tara:strand:+ start:525 stop:728 length:204 start_codon:yes stop_codon:yes gene_type:complete
MKATDMRSMSVEGLRQYILDGRQELMNLRFQQANLVLNGTSRMRELKKDIARAKTIINEKKLSGEAA